MDTLGFNYDRRFGVEIEMNSLDRRDFKANPLDKGEFPKGIDYVATLIEKKLKVPVKILTWHHTHNNFNDWILKPDSSCGIEVCSPAARGWLGFGDIVKVVEIFSEDRRISIDGRCSFHIHVNVEDALKKREFTPYALSGGWSLANSWGLANIVANWIKCEPVFMDCVPSSRKVNRYCQCIGMSDLFRHDDPVDPEFLINNLGQLKYFTLNTYHLCNGHRPTIEFRIAEAAACFDPVYAKNWMRLILHFVEQSLVKPTPSNLLWYDPMDVMELLDFTTGNLSDELVETRNWFLARLYFNIKSRGSIVWSEKARAVASRQIDDLMKMFNFSEFDLSSFVTRRSI